MGLGGCASGDARLERADPDHIGSPRARRSAPRSSQACTTPCTLTVSRKDEFSVSSRQAGLSAADHPGDDARCRARGVAGFAGNIVAGGIVGMGVDAASGATLEHHPNPVVAVLQPVAAGAAARPQQPGRQRKNDGAEGLAARTRAARRGDAVSSAVVTEPRAAC